MKHICLTLPEQPERTERATAHFKERGIDVQFVSAINGHLTGLKATHPYELDHPGTGYVIGPATVGIYLSHYIAWSIVAAGEHSAVMITEDDVILHNDFKAKLNEVMNDLPEEWDMVFLGSCCTNGEHRYHVKGDVFGGLFPQCLHCYIITPSAANVLLRKCRDVFAPLDCLLRLNKYFGLNVMTVLPRIATQLNTELPE